MSVPVCCSCKNAMRCERNGVYIHDEEHNGVPVRYYCGDRYECPWCGVQVITGYRGSFESREVLPSMGFGHGSPQPEFKSHDNLTQDG